MAGAVMNKVMEFFGYDAAGDVESEEQENVYGYNYGEEDEIEEENENKSGFFGRKSKVVAMPQMQQVKMVVTQPTTFEQSEELCNYLKERKSVIINLEYVSKDVARRIIDFISGSVNALDGHIQKISNAIFLVTPINYDIDNDMMAREEIKSKLSVSWLKNN